MREAPRVDVLVIGSGAGGATTALVLAESGRNVTVLEEGDRNGLEHYGQGAVSAMQRLYRRCGMTPILGRPPIGFVEGMGVGGSTEINSGFWHRTPRDVLVRWEAKFDLREATPEILAPHFAWAEQLLGVGLTTSAWPKSTEVFARGARALGWAAEEVPRAAPGCRNTNSCANGCPTGAKQGMSRALWPRAEAAGARLLPGRRVRKLLHDGRHVSGVVVEVRAEDGSIETERIAAEQVFLCAGPTQSPALLRRSGIRRHVGDTLQIHPMLKVVARFPEIIDAQASVLPLVQVKEFWPEISLGGGFFTAGHAAMMLSDNWRETASEMSQLRQLAAYYVAVRGTGLGSVRPALRDDDGAVIRYRLSDDDVRHLSQGLAHLAALLLAGGAEVVFPSVSGLPAIRSQKDAGVWLDRALPRAVMSLTTVHAFSSCPIGERADYCAADSHGRVHGFDNLYVNDASILPDSPGVNPQGTVMALARRNALHFQAGLS